MCARSHPHLYNVRMFSSTFVTFSSTFVHDSANLKAGKDLKQDSSAIKFLVRARCQRDANAVALCLLWFFALLCAAAIESNPFRAVANFILCCRAQRPVKACECIVKIWAGAAGDCKVSQIRENPF